jgi:hypothetical protein
VPQSRLPLSLQPLRFRFQAVASHAARAPLGGQREVALGVLMVARLAADTLPGGLPGDVRRERATGARQWLGALTVPVGTRNALAAALASTAGDDAAAVAQQISVVLGVTGERLSAAARAEVERLALALERAAAGRDAVR